MPWRGKLSMLIGRPWPRSEGSWNWGMCASGPDLRLLELGYVRVWPDRYGVTAHLAQIPDDRNRGICGSGPES